LLNLIFYILEYLNGPTYLVGREVSTR